MCLKKGTQSSPPKPSPSVKKNSTNSRAKGKWMNHKPCPLNQVIVMIQIAQVGQMNWMKLKRYHPRRFALKSKIK
jgi:hypothetical protein